jgi:hypothetical protein
VFFVGFHNVIIADERFYLSEMFLDKKPEDDKIIVEVLNASKRSDYALDVTRKLRDKNVDVQRWGNYVKIMNATLVIDRSGAWRKTFQVLEHMKDFGFETIIFSNEDKNAFVDASVILGEK